MSNPLQDARDVFFAGAVVQASFSLVLLMLTIADRSIRGTRWLAASSLLGLAGMALFAVHLESGGSIWYPPGALVFLASAVMAYAGLHWFMVRTGLWSRPWLAAVLAAGGILVLSGRQPVATTVAMRVLSIGMLGAITLMLLRPRITAMRGLGRALAAAVVAVGFFGALTTVLETSHTPRHAVLPQACTLVLLATLQMLYVALYLRESARRLDEETRLDPLTGLRNRRAIAETAALIVEQAASQRRPLSLLMLDLDHFKALNDTWGHALGDRALQAVGVVLSSVAPVKCVARLGGEEFAVLLPGIDVRSAGEMAETLRGSIERLRLDDEEFFPSGDDIKPSLTTSIGVSSLHAGEREWTALLHRADVALYRAKREGRNRVVLCDQPQPQEWVKEGVMESEPSWRRFLAGRGPLL